MASEWKRTRETDKTSGILDAYFTYTHIETGVVIRREHETGLHSNRRLFYGIHVPGERRSYDGHENLHVAKDMAAPLIKRIREGRSGTPMTWVGMDLWLRRHNIGHDYSQRGRLIQKYLGETEEEMNALLEELRRDN